MNRFGKILASSILSLALFAGCAAPSSAPDQVKPADQPAAQTDAPKASGGKLIIGLDDTFAPMGFRDEKNTLVGFDIDLATAVCAEMGVEPVFQPIDWDAKEMELESKKIDCIWNGMSRTPEREESMTLSQNYLNNKIIVMTAPDVVLTSKDQMKDYKVGTQAKSAALEVIQADDVFETIQPNLSEYRTYDECLLDIQAGRIQVMVVDEVLGTYKNSKLDTQLNIASFNFGEDFYVIGFRKADTELCKQVEGAIKAVEASGKGKEISQKWFGTDLLLPIQ